MFGKYLKEKFEEIKIKIILASLMAINNLI